MDMLKKSRNKSQGENTRVFISKNMLCGFYSHVNGLNGEQ